MGQKIENKDFFLLHSDIVTVGTTITLEAIRAEFPHCFVGVQFFQDSAGATPGTPTAGTLTITVETVNTQQGLFEAVPNNVINCNGANRTTVNWSANTKAVKATPAGISGGSVTHMRIIVTANLS